MTSDSSDPWKNITPPDNLTNVSALRADASLPWNVFWAVDTDRNCLLMLQHHREAPIPSRLPRLRGLKVETRSPDAGQRDLLVVRLLDREQREIFHRLCLDIIEATRVATTEEEAIHRFLARTWRWHRLLMGGRDGRLSEDEQKGLIGELQLLKTHLFPALGVASAVRCWVGPFGAPKDFEIGRVCVEAKARRGTATPHVAISSEHQLDSSGADVLFLYIMEVTAAAEEVGAGVTITETVEEVRSVIAKHDPATVDLFEERLAAVGFDWADDYSDKRWLGGHEYMYEVRDGFPRIAPLMFPRGVSNVRYMISLPDCDPFRADIADLVKLIKRGNDDNRS